VKNLAGKSAQALEFAADRFSVARTINLVTKTGTISVLDKALTVLGLSTANKAAKIELNIPPVGSCSGTLQCMASYSLFVSKAAITAIACTNPLGAVACATSITALMINEAIVPMLQRMSNDPFDPDYAQVFIPIDGFPTPKFNTGDFVVDSIATDALTNFD